jgi:hypothetical protein
VSIIYLAIYGYRLVEEARATRMMQIQPGLSIFLQHAETGPTLIFIIFQNIGLGIAYQLRFNIERDIRDYGSNVRTPIKLTTSGRGKLTTCFAGEDFQFMSVQAVHNY